jgi:pimeloyl-ACP methyl ester carboxylesterase
MYISAETASRGPAATSVQRWANLSGRSHGERDGQGCPIVLLHGLTFDHQMWNPVMDLLARSHRAIAFDLPGHGASPSLGETGLRPVVAAIHDAVLDAGLTAPIVVGHSIAGAVATTYASQHPAAAVVSVEDPVRLEPFATFVRSLRAQLIGDEFAATWAVFQESWHMDLLRSEARALLAAGDRPGDDRLQQVVLSYQADVLEGTLEEVARWRDAGLAQLRAGAVPYVTLHTSSLDRASKSWLVERLPQAEILEWPVGHHFPHVSHPDRVAALVSGLAACCFKEAGR